MIIVFHESTEGTLIYDERDKQGYSFHRLHRLHVLKKDRLNYPRNPLTGYLSISSMKNKISDIREVFGKLQLDYFVFSETKIGNSFPLAQCSIPDYEIRNRMDKDKHRGLIEFVRKRFITIRMKAYETKLSETSSTEFTVSK